MLRANVIEKFETHILFSIIFFRKSCLLWDNVEKSCRVGQDTWHVTCLLWLNTYGYKYTHWSSV